MAKIYYILLSFFFISCNNEECYTIIGTNSETYEFSLKTDKTGLSSYWSTGDTIGITAYMSGSENSYLNSINKQYKLSGNGDFVYASKEDNIYHPLVSDYVDFIAYYPYKADAFTTYTISLKEQANQKQIDLLYSNNAKNKTKSSGNVEFVFNHVLSKIVIKASPSNLGDLVKEDLYGMNVSINNVCNEATFNLSNGYIESYAQRASIKMKTEADGSLSEAIILPGPISGIWFTIELANGNTYSADFPNGQQLASGYIYTYQVTITQAGIILNPIEIENWIVDRSIPNEEIADEIIYQTGDFYPNPNNPKTAIGVVYWLKPGTGGREGKIVSVDSELKNWGDSNNDDLNTRISAGTFNWEILINRDPTLENFPAFKWCKDKGDGWYLPSRYELHVLNELLTMHGEYMNSNIELIGGEPFMPNDIYLVSSESRNSPGDMAEIYNFATKGWSSIYKNVPERIRAVKEF